MLLGIKTDSPVAEFVLYDSDGSLLAMHQWQADRQLARELLAKLQDFLVQHNTSFVGLKGLFVFEGPGSFTGLRIGITVMNSLAYSLEIPIVGVRDGSWQRSAIRRLGAHENDRVVLPFYGAEARVTTPKK